MKRTWLSHALSAVLFLFACIFPAGCRSVITGTATVTSVKHTSTPTPRVEPTRTSTIPASASGNCYYVWAYHGDEEGTARVRRGLEAAGVKTTQLFIQLFGEDSVCSDGKRTFGLMDSSLGITVVVNDLDDQEALGALVRKILEADGVLTVVKRIELTFMAGSETAWLRFTSTQGKNVLDQGLNGLELWLALNSSLATAGLSSMAFSPDGQWLLTSSSDGNLRLWETQTGKLHRVFITGKHGGEVAFAPDGASFYHASGNIRLYRVEDGSLITRIDPSQGEPYALALSPGGKYLASISHMDNNNWGILAVRAVEGAALRLLYTQPSLKITALAISPDAQYLAVNLIDYGGVQVLDLASGNPIYSVVPQLPAPNSICNDKSNASLAFSPDGTKLALSFCVDYINVFDTTNHSLKEALEPSAHLIRAITFSPDGKYLAIATRDGVELHSTADWAVVTVLKKPTECTVCNEEVTNVIFSPDGRLLASGLGGGGVHIWRVEDGMLVAEFGM
jgi:DNA-binding beta-propeller fold protein YncE